MHMNKKGGLKELSIPKAIILTVVIVLAGVGTLWGLGALLGTGATGQITGGPLGGGDVIVSSKSVSAIDVKFWLDSIDAAAQDSVNDLDIDIFEWTPEDNADAVDDAQLDCSGATAVQWDGDNNNVDVPDSALCQINFYKFWRDSSYTGGDSETKLDDNFIVVKKDVGHKDNASSQAAQLPTTDGEGNLKTYLVTVVETSTTSNDDVVPFAFLFQLNTETTHERDEIANGNIDVTFKKNYYSDARANSKTKVEGSCDDNQDKSPTLDSALSGAIDSSLTTEVTNWRVTCDVKVSITDKGYALILNNPLAESDTEKAYLQDVVYGRASNDTTPNPAGSETAWSVMNGSSVVYDDTEYPTYQYTVIWESSTACGKTLTDTSATDALVGAGEKLYDLDCLKNAWGKDASVTFPHTITGVNAKYESANATDDVLQTDENFIDVSVYDLESGSDIVAQILDG